MPFCYNTYFCRVHIQPVAGPHYRRATHWNLRHIPEVILLPYLTADSYSLFYCLVSRRERDGGNSPLTVKENPEASSTFPSGWSCMPPQRAWYRFSCLRDELNPGSSTSKQESSLSTWHSLELGKGYWEELFVFCPLHWGFSYHSVEGQILHTFLALGMTAWYFQLFTWVFLWEARCWSMLLCHLAHEPR